MLLSLSTLLPMAVQTVQHPREGVRQLTALNLPRNALWQALLLTEVLSLLLGMASSALLFLDAEAPATFMDSPLQLGTIQFALLALTVCAIFFVSRAMGGTGSFDDGLLIVVWLQFIMICLQALAILLALVMPGLSVVVLMASFALSLWLMTNFVAEIHGFQSLPKVFLMILASAFAFVMCLAILSVATGITVPGITPNV